VTIGDFKNLVGLYNAVWLGMVFLLLIFFADNAAFLLPLVFAGMCSSFLPLDDSSSYPWDMPAMFFFTLSCLLWLKGKYGWMLPVIVLGTWFKETVAVTAFLFFFTPMGRRRQIGLFAGTACACLLLKLWVTHGVLGHAEIVTEEFNQHGGFGSFLLNLQTLGLHWNHPIFANAGTLVVALCLPMKDRIDRGIKTVLAMFCIGHLFGGALLEFREFMEVLPITAIYLNRAIQNRTNQAETASSVSATIKSICWLGVGLLLAVAIGLSTAGALPPEANKPNPLDAVTLRPGPDSVEDLNDLALALATNPNAKERNGALAVGLAERACERTQYRQPLMMSTLGLAYAEAGRFDDAIAAAQKACVLADEFGRPDIVEKNQKLLILYRARQSFHDAVVTDETKLPRP